jgi:hypothetical protein
LTIDRRVVASLWTDEDPARLLLIRPSNALSWRRPDDRGQTVQGGGRRPGDPLYGSSDGTNLAYQMSGDGPLELVFVPAPIPIDLLSDDPGFVRLRRRLEAFSCTVWFDARGMERRRVTHERPWWATSPMLT